MIPYLTLAPAGVLIGHNEQRLRIPLAHVLSWTATSDDERSYYGYAGAKLRVVGYEEMLYVQDSVASIDAAFDAAT